MTRPDKYDWKEIKNAYVSSEMTYGQIAEQFGVPRGTVRQRGGKEHWSDLRGEYRSQVSRKLAQKSRDKAVSEGVKALKSMQESSTNLAAAIQRITEEAEPTIYTGDSRALSDLAKAMKDLTTVIRNVYGLPTAQEAESMRIAGERLKIEQRKAESGDADPEVIVRIEGEEGFAE